MIARLRPALCRAGVKEPRVLVRGNWKDADSVGKHELTYNLWSATVENYEAGIALKAMKYGAGEAQTVTFNPFTEEPPEDGGLAAAVNAHQDTITWEPEMRLFHEETSGIRRVEIESGAWERAIPVFRSAPGNQGTFQP